MNKKIAYFLCTGLIPLTFLCGCADRLGRPKETVKTDSAVVVSKLVSPTLNEYLVYITSLKPEDITTVKKGVDKYHSLFAGKDTSVCDTAFVLFNLHYDNVNTAANTGLANDPTDYSVLAGHQPVPPSLQAINEQIHQNGFFVGENMGTTFIAQERDSLKSWFYDYISPTFKTYLDQLNIESKAPFYSDAAMKLEPKAFVDRIIWWERFINSNPRSLSTPEAKGKKQLMLTYLIEGMENTPITGDNGAILDYYSAAYEYLKTTYPETETNKLVAPYYEAVKAKNYMLQKSIIKDYTGKGYLKYLEE